jgi:hypothetical protein
VARRQGLFKALSVKMRIVALRAGRDRCGFMEMHFFAALIANQRPQTDEFAAVISGVLCLQG